MTMTRIASGFAVHAAPCWRAGLGGHVAANLVGQEDGRGLGVVAPHLAAVEISLRNVDVHHLIVALRRAAHVRHALPGAHRHALPARAHLLRGVASGVKHQRIGRKHNRNNSH